VHCSRSPTTVDEWLLVLEFSDKYLVKSGRDAAIQALPTFSPRPSQTLKIAITFHIVEWYEPAARSLIGCHHQEMNEDDFRFTPPEVMQLIWKCRHEIQQHHSALACRPYPVSHDGACCPNDYDMLSCQGPWDIAWKAVMLFLIRPDHPESGRDVFRRLSGMEIPGMRPNCRAYTLESLESKGSLWKGEDILAKGIAAILEWILKQTVIEVTE
jgi:hypothetical protein